jgi:hypothetical protein
MLHTDAAVQRIAVPIAAKQQLLNKPSVKRQSFPICLYFHASQQSRMNGELE